MRSDGSGGQFFFGQKIAGEAENPVSQNSADSEGVAITEVEATHIESLLHQYGGHRARVAEVLKISERTLYRKLKQYNLKNVGKESQATP